MKEIKQYIHSLIADSDKKFEIFTERISKIEKKNFDNKLPTDLNQNALGNNIHFSQPILPAIRSCCKKEYIVESG